MRVGESSVATLDRNTPQISVLAGGQTDGKELGIQNQDGDSLFIQCFALGTHRGFNAANSMKFALEHQNPLGTGRASGSSSAYNDTHYSFLAISDPNVLLWSLKPSEEGIAQGIIARLWNFNAAPSNGTLSLDQKILSAKHITHIETDLENAKLAQGTLLANLAKHQIKTYRLILSESSNPVLKRRK
jgi:alpha-mannosidase